MIVEPDFFGHWKTKMMLNLTGDPSCPLLVLKLWAHCQQRKAWVFPHMNNETLKAVCDWKGDPSDLRSLLEECEWIEKGTLGITVHQWEVVNAALVKNWFNGKTGGRPKEEGKPKKNPTITQEDLENIPKETQEKPNDNPSETQEEPIDRIDRIDREDSNTPKSPKGDEGWKSSLRIPDNLNSEKFLSVFWQWVEFRLGISKIKDPALMFQTQLTALSEWGEAGAIQSINKSIMGGWKILNPPPDWNEKKEPARIDKRTGLKVKESK